MVKFINPSLLQRSSFEFLNIDIFKFTHSEKLQLQTNMFKVLE